MKMQVFASTAIAALLLLGVASIAYANTNSTNHPNQGSGHLTYTVGQTLKFEGLRGHSNNLTNGSNGRASHSTGNFVFNVTATNSNSTTLTIVSGNFTIGTTTYTVSGGTVVLNAGGRSGNGTGTVSGGATFTIKIAGIHLNHNTGLYNAHFKLNVTVGASDYHVLLMSVRSRGHGH
jgi:hypothetical protein